MALLTLVAVIGLAASGASATCIAEGSSAVSSLIVSLAGAVTGGAIQGPTVGNSRVCSASAPQGFCYQANGSGAGRSWIKGAKGALAFGDNSYAGAVISGSGASTVYKNGPLPKTIAEFPIALGAIAWYRNPTAGIPLTACLTRPMMCRVFAEGEDYSGTGRLTYKDLNAAWPATPIVPVIRGDSSGSTDATVAYLKQICSAAWVFPKVSAAGVPSNPGIVTRTGTSGVVGGITSIAGATGYAVCGSKGNLVEWATQNRRGNCIKCSQCASKNPAPGSQCGIYNEFKIQNRLCAWSGTPPNGDKDADSDEVIDLDNDGDGVGPNDYPTVFLEYAMMPVTVPAAQKSCCALFQRLLVFLLNDKTQDKFPTYGFFKLPLNVLQNSCKCLGGRSCGLNIAGLYIGGACK